MINRGKLVPYDTSIYTTYVWKLHGMDRVVIYQPNFEFDNEKRCYGCGAYTSININPYFEYGRPHYVGNTTYGNYYLFGERIDISDIINPICTRKRDYYNQFRVIQECNDKVYSGIRINFANGWAKYMKISAKDKKYTIVLDSAMIDHITGVMVFYIIASCKPFDRVTMKITVICELKKLYKTLVASSTHAIRLC